MLSFACFKSNIFLAFFTLFVKKAKKMSCKAMSLNAKLSLRKVTFIVGSSLASRKDPHHYRSQVKCLVG